MHASMISVAFALFLLMDPLGNIPLFISLLKDFPPQKQRTIILRELCIALCVILSFYFLGNILLQLVPIKEHTLSIAGGVILFLISLRMIFPESLEQKQQGIPNRSEPLIVPLAIPLIAGPAVLASVLLYSQENRPVLAITGAIIIAWTATALLLLSSHFLQKLLGDKVLKALERLMGLILTLIAIEMFLEGISVFICHLPSS